MAKSARSSSRKNNNQRLKKNVFGPIESARTERLAAKLLELAAQPKPQNVPETEMEDADGLCRKTASNPPIANSQQPR